IISLSPLQVAGLSNGVKHSLGKRRRSREFALQVLYQLNITKQDALTALHQFQGHFLSGGEADELLKRLVLGVLEHCQEFDRVIEQYSEHWNLERIHITERKILQMALFDVSY